MYAAAKHFSEIRKGTRGSVVKPRKRMQQLHPFEQKLQPGEVLLWMGRPDKQVYTSANREWHRVAKVCALAIVPSLVAVIGVIFSSDLLGRYASVSLLIAVPLITFILLAPADYQQASWYAFSRENVFLAYWDEGDFVVHHTNISNVKEITVKGLKYDKSTADHDIGSIQCVCASMIPTLLSKRFSFDSIENLAHVQPLLVNAIIRKDENHLPT